jgi:hypothetical protein
MLLPLAERLDALVVSALALLVLVLLIVREEFITVAGLAEATDATSA